MAAPSSICHWWESQGTALIVLQCEDKEWKERCAHHNTTEGASLAALSGCLLFTDSTERPPLAKYAGAESNYGTEGTGPARGHTPIWQKMAATAILHALQSRIASPYTTSKSVRDSDVVCRSCGPQSRETRRLGQPREAGKDSCCSRTPPCSVRNIALISASARPHAQRKASKAGEGSMLSAIMHAYGACVSVSQQRPVLAADCLAVLVCFHHSVCLVLLRTYDT